MSSPSLCSRTAGSKRFISLFRKWVHTSLCLWRRKKESCGQTCTNQLLLQDVWKPLRTKWQLQVVSSWSEWKREGSYVSSTFSFKCSVQLFLFVTRIWKLEPRLSFRCLIRWPQFESQHWRTAGDISEHFGDLHLFTRLQKYHQKSQKCISHPHRDPKVNLWGWMLEK